MKRAARRTSLKKTSSVTALEHVGEPNSRSGVVSENVNEHLSNVELCFLVLVVRVWFVGLLQLREGDDGLHPHSGLFVAHTVKESSLEVLVGIVASRR